MIQEIFFIFEQIIRDAGYFFAKARIKAVNLPIMVVKR